MSRYIDADVFMKNLKTNEHGDTDVNQVEIAIDKSRADVVEVVRCKDCKHHEELLNNNNGKALCWVHDIDVIVDRNGYCSCGEREEQEHE